MANRIVTIPTRFWYDHAERCGMRGAKELRVTPRYTTVSLSPRAYADLKSDADYYADCRPGDMDKEYNGLILSARATLKRLK